MIVDLQRRWQKRALCAGMSGETFFNDHHPNAIYKGQPTASVRAHWERAKMICGQCPVMKECARDNLGEYEGVWGGLDPAQRMQLRRTHCANVRNLEGDLKVEYAALAHDLRSSGMQCRDVARIIGINVPTAQYLVDWYEDHLAATAEAPAVVDLELPDVPAESLIKRPPWPDKAPQHGDGWINYGGTVVAAFYLGETADGEWLMMNAFLSAERSACWLKKRDVCLTHSVATNVMVKSRESGRVYGTAISVKQRRKAAG